MSRAAGDNLSGEFDENRVCLQEIGPIYGIDYVGTIAISYERPGVEWESRVCVERKENASGGSYENTNRFPGRGGIGKQADVREGCGGYGGKGEEIIEERTYDWKIKKLATVATTEKRFIKSVKEVIGA